MKAKAVWTHGAMVASLWIIGGHLQAHGQWTLIKEIALGARVDAAVGENLFASPMDGGILKSRDHGDSWTSARISASDSLIGADNAFSIVPKGSLLFAGTTFGFVFKSSDSGDSWSQANFPDQYHPHCLAANGSYLFAGSYGYGIYRSPDNGNSWVRTNTGLDTAVTALATSTGTVLAGTLKGLFSSGDNGESWAYAGPEKERFPVSCILTWKGRIFIGTYNGIYRTTDNGGSWASIDSGLDYKVVLWMAAGETEIFAAGTEGVYRSTDQGESWDHVSGKEFRSASGLAVLGNTLYTGSSSGIWKCELSKLVTRIQDPGNRNRGSGKTGRGRIRIASQIGFVPDRDPSVPAGVYDAKGTVLAPER